MSNSSKGDQYVEYMSKDIDTMERALPRLVEAFSTGSSINGACRFAAIPRSVFDHWMKFGNPEHPDFVGEGVVGWKGRNYHEFYNTIQAVRGMLEVELVDQIKVQGHRDYRAPVELLQRLFPEDWAPPVNRQETKAVVTHEFAAIAESVRSKLLQGIAEYSQEENIKLLESGGTDGTEL